jgi:hypothetical protein
MNNYNISVVVEHGYPHYKIVDVDTGSETHCDINELNKTIREMASVECLSYDK